MALHDRLRPSDTEQAAARPGHGLLVAVALSVLAAGFAYAMPGAMQISAEDPNATEEVLLVDATPTPDVTATPEVSPTPDGDEDGDAEDGSGDKATTENHGSAVSTAARCDLKGRAHGELVRSVAQDQDATVADAEAACEAAKAAAATAPARGKPEQARSAASVKARAPKPAAPRRGGPPTASETDDDTDGDTTGGDSGSDDASGSSGRSASPGGGKPAKP